MRSANHLIGRRSFLGRATVFGPGVGAQALRPDLVVLQPNEITALDPHATIHTSDVADGVIRTGRFIRDPNIGIGE